MFAITIFAGLAFAETVTTTVHFNVPTITSFTVTLPGVAAVASGATADIEFNSTTGTQVQVNASVVSASASAQTDSVPIFVYTNTGNVGINLNLSLDTVQAGVNVTASNTFAGYEAICTSTALPDSGKCVNVTASSVRVAGSLAAAGTQNVWMWAKFAGVAGGTAVTKTLTHTSAAS